MPYTLEEQKAHRQALVAALRSGKYEQARMALRNANGFCCLGVACDVSGLDQWKPCGSNFKYFGDDCALPDPVRDYYGFANNVGQYEDGSLMSHNDNDWLNFEEIAQVIEDEPEGLVVR